MLRSVPNGDFEVILGFGVVQVFLISEIRIRFGIYIPKNSIPYTKLYGNGKYQKMIDDYFDGLNFSF